MHNLAIAAPLDRMHLDPFTLLFALIVTNALAVVSLVVAVGNRHDSQRDGMGKWAAAMLSETLTLVLAAARGHIPDIVSIVLANTFTAGTYALMLAAICEFQRRTVPRWQYVVPVALSTLAAAVLSHDLADRFVWSSLIYAFQLAMIARALVSDPDTRLGRAWRLLFAGVALIVLVMGLRAFVALTDGRELAQPHGNIAPHPVQILAFVAIMATALLGTIGFVLMVKERADREVLHLAMTDSLTLIPNRRALLMEVERSLAQRTSLPMSLLMIDVDHFKRVNDTYGHLAGDDILRTVAELLARRLRRQDILGRYGGEEFCVLAPNTDEHGARKLAEDLREIVAGTTLTTDRHTLSVTVSIGYVLCHSGSEPSLNELISAADTALYAAKQAGRNRVACFDPALAHPAGASAVPAPAVGQPTPAASATLPDSNQA
ncbi:MAG TPA: GGDEF domain-containing protein [Parasulfuritortus sp.]